MFDYLYLGLYRIFSFLLWVLPDGAIRVTMKCLAWLAYTFSFKHKKIINDNLDLAFEYSLSKKDKKEIGVHSFMNLVDTVFGIIKRDGMDKDEVLKNIYFEGEEIVQKQKQEGKSIIFITGHQGNWELLSQSIAIKFDMILVGIGRKLDSKIMNSILKINREQFNVKMLYKKGAMKGCIKALSRGDSIGILVDQAIRKNQSINVKFFKHEATHTALASILSRKYNIELIPAFINTDDYINYHVKIYEPLAFIKTDNQEKDLALLTQLQANIMEKAIREHPRQWFWMHRRWKGFENEV